MVLVRIWLHRFWPGTALWSATCCVEGPPRRLHLPLSRADVPPGRPPRAHRQGALSPPSSLAAVPRKSLWVSSVHVSLAHLLSCLPPESQSERLVSAADLPAGSCKNALRSAGGWAAAGPRAAVRAADGAAGGTRPRRQQRACAPQRRGRGPRPGLCCGPPDLHAPSAGVHACHRCHRCGHGVSDVHVPLPTACEHVTFRGKRDPADAGRGPWTVQGP